MDSLINYIGHKSKIIDQILEYLPDAINGTFYDVFAGSCVVGLSSPYQDVAFVEKNPYLSKLYHDLTNANFPKCISRLIKRYKLTNSSETPRSEYLTSPDIGTVTWHGKTVSNFHLDKLNEAGYNRLLVDFNANKFRGVNKSAAYMIATIYGRNSDVSVKNLKLAGAVGPLDFSKRCKEKLEEHITVINGKNCSFLNQSYDSITPTEDDFMYFDPPYLASGFRYMGWTEEDEIKLLKYIDSLPCHWALSNSFQSGDKENSLLIEWAKDKNTTFIDKSYRKWASKGTNSSNKVAKKNIEVLITSNFNKKESIFSKLFAEAA